MKLTTFKGILGALLGALIGTGVILLLDQFGYSNADIDAPGISGFQAFFRHGYWFFALVSGVFFALTTVLFSRKMAGEPNKTTFYICVILLIVVPFFADWVAWGITQKADYSALLPFRHYLLHVPEHIQAGVGYRQHMLIDAAFYACNLVTLYAGVIGGAVGVSLIPHRKKAS